MYASNKLDNVVQWKRKLFRKTLLMFLLTRVFKPVSEYNTVYSHNASVLFLLNDILFDLNVLIDFNISGYKSGHRDWWDQDLVRKELLPQWTGIRANA